MGSRDFIRGGSKNTLKFTYGDGISVKLLKVMELYTHMCTI